MATEQQVQQRQQRKPATFRLEPSEHKMLADIAYAERSNMTATVQKIIRAYYSHLKAKGKISE